MIVTEAGHVAGLSLELSIRTKGVILCVKTCGNRSIF